MRLTSEFEIEAPPARAWELLLDVPRVVPCMPGAELVEQTDAEHWLAVVRVKLGPLALVFDVEVEREEVNAAERRVRLRARARERKGRGQAKATIVSALGAAGAGRSRVEIDTELELSGRIAQFGRGAVRDVSEELVARFTENLGAVLDAGQPAVGAPGPARAAGEARVLPILLGAIRRGWRRLRSRLAGARA